MKKRLGFHILKTERGAVEGIVEDVIEDLRETEDPLQMMKEQTKIHRYHFWKTIMFGLVILTMLVMSFYFVLKYQTYNKVNITTVYENKDVDNSNYAEYLNGVLKYNRDGVVYLDETGKEIWNHPCQMKNPMIEMCKSTLAVGDRGGTSILVFQKDGLKGEIKTTSPIQEFSVSEQGIVGAVLKNELTPQVVCYDAKGNILVEQNASLGNTGYPVDLAISNDGNTLLVSYLYTKGGGVATKAVYYNFGEAGKGKKDHQISEKEYEDGLIPSVAFLNAKDSILIGDSFLVFNHGIDEIQETKKIKLEKEIKSVAYDKSGIALVLKNSGKSSYELRTYNANGKMGMSENFEGEYGNIRKVNHQIILFEGNKCQIFHQSGVHKFQGRMEAKIMDIFPITGLDKYMVISTAGLQKVQLVK